MGNWLCRRSGIHVVSPETSEATVISEHRQGDSHTETVGHSNGREILKRESTGMLSSGYSSGTKTTDISKEQANSKIYTGRLKDATSSSKILMTRVNNEESLTPGASFVKRGLNKRDYRKIRRNFCYLKNNLNIDGELLDYFIQEGILTDDQVELIKTERTRRRKVDCFLRMFLRSKDNTFSTVLDILTNTDNGHIRSTLESDLEENDIETESWNYLQSWKCINVLIRYKKEIVTELEPEMILDYLFQYEQFTIDEYEEVISASTRNKLAVKLMKVLATNRQMPRGFVIFLKALKDDKQIYLYKLLQSEDKHVSVANPVNVIAPHVEYLHNEVNSPSTDDDDDDDDVLLIRLKFVSKKKKKHEDIIRNVNNEDVRQVINGILLSETGCLLESVKKGSIIIKLKGCCRDAIRKVLENGYKVGVSKILGILVSVQNMQTDDQTIQVMKVETFHTKASTQETEDESTLNSKKMLRNSFDFLVEELDPKAFLQLTIFTDKEKEDITKIRSTSRSEGTRCMIELTLAKSESKRRLFIEEIKHKKAYVWNYMSEKGNQDDPGKILIRNYKFIVDNICPSLIADQCARNNLISIDKYNQFVLQGKPRSWIAKFILQEVLMKSEKEINTFLHILSTCQQNLYSMVLAENGDADVSEIDQGVDSEADEDLNEDTISIPEEKFKCASGDSTENGGQHSIKGQKDSKDDEGYTTMSAESGRKVMIQLSSADSSTSKNVKRDPSLRDSRITSLGMTSTPDQQGMTDLGN